MRIKPGLIFGQAWCLQEFCKRPQEMALKIEIMIAIQVIYVSQWSSVLTPCQYTVPWIDYNLRGFRPPRIASILNSPRGPSCSVAMDSHRPVLRYSPSLLILCFEYQFSTIRKYSNLQSSFNGGLRFRWHRDPKPWGPPQPQIFDVQQTAKNIPPSFTAPNVRFATEDCNTILLSTFYSAAEKE